MKVPDFDHLREGRPDCPSDFALDRLMAREIAPPELATIESHISGCELCTKRVAERRAGFEAVDGVDPRRMLARIRTAAAQSDGKPVANAALTWVRRLLAPLTLLAAAAVVLIVVRKPDDANTRFKGGFALHVFRLEGDHPLEMISGTAFHANDRLRFALDLPKDGAVHVLGVEPSGKLYTAWPLDAGTSSSRQSGLGVELPGAVELDGTVGRETLYAVVCPAPEDLAKCRSRGASAPPACPAACDFTSFQLEKE